MRKNKGTTECDKSTITCDIDTAQFENDTVKCDVLIPWYSKLSISEYCQKKKEKKERKEGIHKNYP